MEKTKRKPEPPQIRLRLSEEMMGDLKRIAALEYRTPREVILVALRKYLDANRKRLKGVA